MSYITAATLPLDAVSSREEARQKLAHIKKHLEELALDIGLEPNLNVVLVEDDAEIRLGVSEELSEHMGQSAGGWVNA